MIYIVFGFVINKYEIIWDSGVKEIGKKNIIDIINIEVGGGHYG